jgi:hypothetical protein
MLSLERDLAGEVVIPMPEVVNVLSAECRAWDRNDWADVDSGSHTVTPLLVDKLTQYEPDADIETAEVLMQGVRLLTMGEEDPRPYNGEAGLNAVYEAQVQGLEGDSLLDYVAQCFCPGSYAYISQNQGTDNSYGGAVETIEEYRHSMEPLVALAAFLDRHEEVSRMIGELPPISFPDPTAVV